MKKRICAVLLILTVFVSGTGCAQMNQAATEVQTEFQETIPAKKVEESKDMELTPMWQEHKNDPVTLNWYVNFAWFTSPWGKNLVSETITKETGVNIDFITPSGSEEEKLKSMIAQDTLPDLITLDWSSPQVGEMIENDMVYAFDELADQYDPYWYQVADSACVSWYTRKDGHIYEYPNSSFSPVDIREHDNVASNQTFLVRKDIYEAIGSPDMTTPEGFEAAVEKAVQMYPLIDGMPLIPVGVDEFTENGNASFDKYLPNFLAIPFEKNGEYYDRGIDGELVRWLKTFRRLAEKGFLAEDIFIDKRAQMEEKIAQGRYFCMIYQRTDLVTQEKMLYAKNPDSIYIAVDGPKNQAGEDYKLPASGINGWTVTLISKNCENPERALEFCSYLMSRHGQEMIWLGVEGETWDYVDGVPAMHEDVGEMLIQDRVSFDQLYGADATYWMLMDNVMALDFRMPQSEPLKQMEEWTYPYVVDNSAYNITLPADSNEAGILSKIDSEWGRVLPQLLLAGSEEEFDQLWTGFCQKRVSWGIRSVLNKKTDLMKEAKEKLKEYE